MPDTKSLSLHVPKRHIGPLVALLRASDSQFEAFAQGLIRPSRSWGIGRLIAEVGHQTGWPEPQDATALTGLLATLFAMADSLEPMSLDAFADEVTRAAQATGDERLREPHGLRERLIRLLGPKTSLWLIAKASVLVSEQERQFCDARILTDLRPIFDRQTGSGPAALVVVHTLKLMFHHGDEDIEEFFVALDDEDLQTLKKVIQRAEEKQTVLGQLIQKTGVPLVPPRNA